MFLKIKLFLFAFLLSYYTFSQEQGQGWVKDVEISFKNIPTAYSSDFQGNIFIGFADGSLIKYSPQGKLLENFSLANNSAISLVDVQNNLKPFIFYYDNQQVAILDRFSTVPKYYALEDMEVSLGIISCPTPDGHIWVMENNPQRLKKIDPLRKSTLLEVQLAVGDSLVGMIAYQNLLILGDKNGLHAFDQYGGAVYSSSIPNLLNFQVTEGDLYAFSTEKMRKLNLFEGTLISEELLPEKVETACLKILSGLLLLNRDKATYYQIIK